MLLTNTVKFHLEKLLPVPERKGKGGANVNCCCGPVACSIQTRLLFFLTDVLIPNFNLKCIDSNNAKLILKKVTKPSSLCTLRTANKGTMRREKKNLLTEASFTIT